MKSATKKKTARATKTAAAPARKTSHPAKAAKAPAHVTTGAKAAVKPAPAKTAARPAASKPVAKPAAKTVIKVAPKPAPRPPAPVLTPKQLEFYRRALLEKKATLAEAYNKNKTYGRLTEDEGTQDLADKASSAYTKEFLYSLSNTDREILQKVDEALQRVDRVGFGQCVECGAEINRKRLEAVPWARYCISCQEKVEKGLL
jgi:DnaK suppressor protein